MVYLPLTFPDVLLNMVPASAKPTYVNIKPDPVATAHGKLVTTYPSLTSVRSIQFTDNVYIGASEAFSLSMWFYNRGYSQHTFPSLCELALSGTESWTLFTSNETDYTGINIGDSDGVLNIARTDLPESSTIGGPHHLFVGYNGAGGTTRGNFTIRLDGVEAALTGNLGLASITGGNFVGTAGSEPWDGEIWDFALWSNRLLSDPEQLSLSNPATRWDAYATPRPSYMSVSAGGGTFPKGPLGHPLIGPFGGPI